MMRTILAALLLALGGMELAVAQKATLLVNARVHADNGVAEAVAWDASGRIIGVARPRRSARSSPTRSASTRTAGPCCRA